MPAPYQRTVSTLASPMMAGIDRSIPPRRTVSVWPMLAMPSRLAITSRETMLGHVPKPGIITMISTNNTGISAYAMSKLFVILDPSASWTLFVSSQATPPPRERGGGMVGAQLSPW